MSGNQLTGSDSSTKSGKCCDLRLVEFRWSHRHQRTIGLCNQRTFALVQNSKIKLELIGRE